MPSEPQPLPSEQEVRAVVERVVDALLGAGGQPEQALQVTDAGGSPEPTVHGDTAAEAIAVGADHGGYRLKEELAGRLVDAGYRVIDCGTDSQEPVDYPEIAHAVARRVAAGEARRGVIVDGAGIGSAMVANKVPGVRAAACYDISAARNSQEHNHANVLTLGAGLTGTSLAWQILEEWLAVEWGGGRHARRVDMIMAIESQYAAPGS